MRTPPLFAALGVMLFGSGTLFAQSSAKPDSTHTSSGGSTVVIRQSGTGNSATVTQTSADGKTTVVTSTNGGNTSVVRHDGNSSVHIEQSGPADRPKPAPDKRKPD
ncbi:hypothetical protein [Fibrella aquatilis]|uniref:DUF3060 domain-containing protein n=1 Tax=Fibrella aquatilis TaxID=2817059 RepID=A0A939JZ42_9BACT|nr:hypothetical protein [Fibrella aquatilis]MBO0934672.1 hypothetical protein [Fibrella aquatilis]